MFYMLIDIGLEFYSASSLSRGSIISIPGYDLEVKVTDLEIS